MKTEVISVEAENKKPVYNKQLGVVFNGRDNSLPLLIEALIEASPTTGQCAGVYQSFINGSGFSAEFVSEPSVNLLETFTPNDLLREVCEPISNHQGVFIHVTYNALYEKEQFNVVPYDLCRVGKQDSRKYSGLVVYSPDGWDKRIDKKKIKTYDAYNPNPVVIAEQVERDGGWHNYKGQILYFKLSGDEVYSKSLVERCYLQSDTEAALGLHYNRTSKAGFKDAWIVRHKKFDSKAGHNKFRDNLKTIYGNEKAGGVLMVEDEFDSENKEASKFKFDFLEDKTKSEKYKHFEESSANMIRKAFKNIPPQLIDFVQGKLGNTSADDLKAAEALYNKSTAFERERLELLFRELYRNYHIDINPSGDWSIGLFKLMDDGTIEEQEEEPLNNEE